jgi:Ca2+-binding RTX toxin-like protein
MHTPFTDRSPRQARPRSRTAKVRAAAGATTMAMVALLLPLGLGSSAQAANIVGQGFTVSPADLSFILKQIKIAEAHSAVLAAQGPGPSTDPVRCQSMIGTAPNQIESPLVSFGLRTVDGSCNNLQPGQATYGAADQTFPRLTTPVFKDAEPITSALPVGAPGPTSYKQTTGSVVDSEPRTVSNLIVDQTSTNPAAVAAAGFPIRSQGNEGVVVCTTPPTSPGGTDGLPVGCVPERQTLDIPNVTTDVGLSPPFNSLFTIFGQFFDHGLDKITNGGNGTVFVTLNDDDPLVTHGPDGIAGNGDEVTSNKFMPLTRGTIKPGADGFRNAENTDTPFVDQSQTYTSHSSHQVFLRQYVNNTAGRPVSTGKFLSTPDGEGLATWAMIKAQAASMLGLQLVDADVNNIPLIDADPYGKFIPGPNGLPRYRTTTGGFVEGNLANPVPAPTNVARIGTAFLNDIAHSAAPTATPDTDTVAGGSLDTPVPAGSYDNELLDLHAICGDGRCNENIALQAVHQVFHDEHDRLIGDIQSVLTNDTSTSGVAALAEWKSAAGAGGWNGERLFQAARFVTEMEYQHLVFEEFARKVQPGINPFEPFAFTQTDVNPAITAEFAHAVYRFGHSMLMDDIPRINADGSRNDIKLLDGFLNPAAYYKNGTATLSSADAAGSILMGLSDQVGQEIDEFVVNTLRNNLLGLPLDLPAVNMARARSEGIPPLNDVRRQIFASTNDGQLKPYTDWVDFGDSLKHPESLVNFVAAYGTHPTITGTLAERREAARLIVSPGTGEEQPFDAADFMFGTNHDETADNTPGDDGILLDDPDTAANEAADNGPGEDGLLTAVDDPDTNWANVGGKTVTGVDKIDLWVGGLAEHTNLFGGLLGSTFNYVFENQLTNLQNGDRFYYLARTPGMNLRAQLEGNSFSELVMRNTPAHTLKADPFATADCKFEVGNLVSPATSVGSSGKLITGTGSVQDDPKSECDENEQLLRMADGTWRYRTTNTAMPSGINAQAVYNAKAGSVVDRIWGGADNDTFWGGPGNDIIEGGDGADIALGGEGNDIITDSAGDDVPKGGPGNDAIDGGPGLDILMGGDGNDFTNGGANTNETFGGAGDDFAIAGQGMDAVFGDSGNDWAEGGDQPDLLIGDSSSFFFDDHNLPGHDILIGQGGDDDYDMEGGDDIGVAGPGVEKTAGAAGFDWQTGQSDPQAQDMDLAQVFVDNGVIIPGVRDKFNEVEALSGGNLNDKLRGDDVVPAEVAGGGFVGCDALDAAGVARIRGLDALVSPDMLTVPSAGVIAAAVTHACLLEGNVWGAGNILLGGAGDDTIEGRGADDIIDGDRYVNVRLSVRTDPNNAASEIGSTDLMTGLPKTGNFGPDTTGMTLQQAVFAGKLNPGNIVAVREILTSDTANADVALFSGPLANYTRTVATVRGEQVFTVTDNVGTDGVDTVRNVETLRFTDGDILTNPTAAAAPTAVTATAGNAQASLAWTAPTNNGGSPITGYRVQVRTGTTVVRTDILTGTGTTTTVAGLTNGTAYNFRVRAVTGFGLGVLSDPSNTVTPLAPASAPGTPVATARNTAASLTWTAPANNGGSPITQYRIQIRTGATVVRTVDVPATPTNAVVTGLTNGTVYNFRVRAITAFGLGDLSNASNNVTPVTTAPAAPVIGTAVAGVTTDTAVSATARWTTSTDNGGSAITGYRVYILRMDGAGNVLATTQSAVQPALPTGARTLVVTGLVANSNYRFQVTAINARGESARSARSNAVVAR